MLVKEKANMNEPFLKILGRVEQRILIVYSELCMYMHKFKNKFNF